MPEPRGKLEKLHTLTGIVPLGGFTIAHLAASASILFGGARFDQVMGAPSSAVASAAAIVLVWIPLAAHAASGAYLALARRAATGGRRVARWTALAVAVFLGAHVASVRAGGAGPELYGTSLAAQLSTSTFSLPLVAFAYLLGIGATALHLAAGAHGALEAWGVVTTPRGRARSKAALTALGLLLFCVGAGAVVAFATGSRLLSGGDPGTNAPCGEVAPASPSPPASSAP